MNNSNSIQLFKRQWNRLTLGHSQDVLGTTGHVAGRASWVWTQGQGQEDLMLSSRCVITALWLHCAHKDRSGFSRTLPEHLPAGMTSLRDSATPQHRRPERSMQSHRKGFHGKTGRRKDWLIVMEENDKILFQFRQQLQFVMTSSCMNLYFQNFHYYFRRLYSISHEFCFGT